MSREFQNRLFHFWQSNFASYEESTGSPTREYSVGRKYVGVCWRVTGASPNRRDYGRRLCAEEWARFCGRHSCADAIAKYIRSTKYFFTKTFLLAKEKWKSEPDLVQLTGTTSPSSQHKATRRDSASWLQRHLSLKRKKQQVRSYVRL